MMSKLRRIDDPRTVYFITNVTHERQPVLLKNIDLFWSAISTVRSHTPFDLQAWVVLPEHFHLVIDVGAFDISNILQRTKMSFRALYHKRLDLRSGRVWQHRFWDHIIRDEADWRSHVDYIHYNPVKHGYVSSPYGWENSSIHRFEGREYSDKWGEIPIAFEGEFGE